MVTLTAAQLDALLQPLDGRRVRQVQGNSHLEAWDVRRHLLRVFGWGGWDFNVLSCECIMHDPHPSKDGAKTVHTVIYRVVGQLVVRDPEGTVLATFTDAAAGDAVNQPSLGDAHDLAMKTASSQALKRCAMNLGDRYGLSLYNDGATAAVVGKTLGNPHLRDVEADEAVNGGELAGAGDESAATLPLAPARTERAAQALEDGGLVEKAERLRAKAAEKTPTDRKAVSAQ